MNELYDATPIGAVAQELIKIYRWRSTNWNARKALLNVRDIAFPDAHVFSFSVGDWGIYQDDRLIALIQLECSSQGFTVENTRLWVNPNDDECSSEEGVEHNGWPNEPSVDGLAREILRMLDCPMYNHPRAPIVARVHPLPPCQAEGCTLPADFEVYYFDLYPELKEVWCQQYDGCSALCEQHVLENELYGHWGRTHQCSGYLYTPNAGEKKYSMASYRPLTQWCGLKRLTYR